MFNLSTKETLKENKEMKLRKILRKCQPNFWHYVKEIEAQVKKLFSYKKNVYFI